MVMPTQILVLLSWTISVGIWAIVAGHLGGNSSHYVQLMAKAAHFKWRKNQKGGVVYPRGVPHRRRGGGQGQERIAEGGGVRGVTGGRLQPVLMRPTPQLSFKTWGGGPAGGRGGSVPAGGRGGGLAGGHGGVQPGVKGGGVRVRVKVRVRVRVTEQVEPVLVL